MDDEEALVSYLIDVGEAVEYGEPWNENTTHEWWQDSDGRRHVRLVQTYHGGGGRGDDVEGEYARRLLDLGRAVHDQEGLDRDSLPAEVTHIIDAQGQPQRFRRYNPPPQEV